LGAGGFRDDGGVGGQECPPYIFFAQFFTVIESELTAFLPDTPYQSRQDSAVFVFVALHGEAAFFLSF
jgi:hypothetical protein